MLCFTEVNIFCLTKDQASNEAPGLSVVRGKFHPWASHPMSSMSRRAALKPVWPCSPGGTSRYHGSHVYSNLVLVAPLIIPKGSHFKLNIVLKVLYFFYRPYCP